MQAVRGSVPSTGEQRSWLAGTLLVVIINAPGYICSNSMCVHALA